MAAPEEILQLLAGKWEDGTRPKDVYAERVAKKPEAYVDVLLAGLKVKDKRVQNGCAEIVSITSEARPDLFYPHLELLAKNFDAKEPILRWEAVCQMGCLAAADKAGKTIAYIEPIKSVLNHKSIVLQVHAVRALGKIGRAHPKHAKDILETLFAAAEHFPGNRVGFLVEAAEMLMDVKGLKPRIRELVTPYSTHEVSVVAKKANRLLKKLAKA